MKNKEKYAKEILDIACNGGSIAVTKENKIVYCSNISCESCMFHIECSQGCSDLGCSDRLREWSESEYVEKPTITSKEKAFLDTLISDCKYIARDRSNDLYVYYNKPRRNSMNKSWTTDDSNTDDSNYFYVSRNMFGDMFNFIKWEDEKPWSIEDLKKLDVKNE